MRVMPVRLAPGRPAQAAALLAALALFSVWWLALTAERSAGFSGHMAIHVLNVAIAAPLLALALPATADQWLVMVRAWRSPMVIAVVEMVVVWGWHMPAAHAFARTHALGFAVEQVSFLLVAMLLWGCAFAAWRLGNRPIMAQSVFALLFTSMHMTLLGTLLGLSSRPYFPAELCGSAVTGLTALQDVQTGGAMMLAAAGSVYLIGGLVLTAALLRPGAVGNNPCAQGSANCSSVHRQE